MVRRVLPALIGLLGVAVIAAPPPAKAETPYTIEGFGPGSRAEPDDDFQCQASEQIAGFTWCQKTRQERSRRGSFTSTYSIVRDKSGVTAYVSRSLEPAFFGPNDVQSEIARLSTRFGERAREMRPPQRDGGANAVIAAWGKLKLEPVEGEALAALAGKEPPRQSFLVDHLGDVKRSIELGLPVYRLSGGAGYVWSASVVANGRGHLRFLAADPSALIVKERPVAAAKDRPAVAVNQPPPVVKEQPASSAAPKPKKFVAAYSGPAASEASQPQPLSNPAGVGSANTTVRAKSMPEHAVPTRPANELDRAVLESERVTTYDVASEHTGSIRLDTDAAPPPASLRVETVVVLAGAAAVLIFFFASLIERLLRVREPTGLELLEMEWRRESVEEEQQQTDAEEIERTTAAASTWRHSSVRSWVDAVAGALPRALPRLAGCRDRVFTQINDSLKAVMVRISPPAARS